MRTPLLLAAVLVAGVAMADVVDTVPLRHKPAAEIVPALQQAFPDAGIQGFYDQLIVRAPDAATLAAITALVERLDTPTRRLTVTVEQRESGAEASVDTDAAVVISNSGSAAAVRLGATQSGGTRSAVQKVTTMDGGRAMISLGESRFVPVLSWSYRPGYRIATYGGQWQDAGSGFWVAPALQGGEVRLRLYPQSSRFNADGSIAYRGVYSEVAGALGEWLPVGETTRQASASGIGTSASATTRYTVWVRVDATP
ncbi:hypothetical protein [Jeongeupia naejangsanensis]|uniref:NolW-like domain-containing protein n=1 Tax=Jeongeupia naejangsanensis TaxID=613195 RepID=A0ABS2BM52_9NEIS|nr:hypothetical protein [Jeongeupia naejangsanensis]MBM3116696.1 hypothetical protein [Jeongeupia naejangsanensis]